MRGSGHDWLARPEGQSILRDHGAAFVKTKGGEAHFISRIGQDWLAGPDGQILLQNHGDAFAASKSGEVYLRSAAGQAWWHSRQAASAGSHANS